MINNFKNYPVIRTSLWSWPSIVLNETFDLEKVDEISDIRVTDKKESKIIEKELSLF